EDIPQLWNDSGIWRGVGKSRLNIHGALSIAASPMAWTHPSHIDPDLLEAARIIGARSSLAFTGGPASNLTFSIGILSSTMAINPYPSIQYQTTYGTQGLITLQAVDTGYAFAQFLNEAYEQNDGYSEISAGETKRVITRREVADSDMERIR